MARRVGDWLDSERLCSCSGAKDAEHAGSHFCQPVHVEVEEADRLGGEQRRVGQEVGERHPAELAQVLDERLDCGGRRGPGRSRRGGPGRSRRGGPGEADEAVPGEADEAVPGEADEAGWAARAGVEEVDEAPAGVGALAPDRRRHSSPGPAPQAVGSGEP